MFWYYQECGGICNLEYILHHLDPYDLHSVCVLLKKASFRIPDGFFSTEKFKESTLSILEQTSCLNFSVNSGSSPPVAHLTT